MESQECSFFTECSRKGKVETWLDEELICYEVREAHDGPRQQAHLRYDRQPQQYIGMFPSLPPLGDPNTPTIWGPAYGSYLMMEQNNCTVIFSFNGTYQYVRINLQNNN